MALEEFQGFEQGDKMDAASFEKFKERMKAAAAQIQAIKKEEKKRKKKEDELVKILLKFIQHSQKRDLVLLISRSLERNIPANFLLAIVLLGNEDIQKEVGEFLILPGMKEQIEATMNARNIHDARAEAQAEAQAPNGAHDTRNAYALMFFQDDASLPLKVRIEVDHWMSNMLYQASESPGKLLATAYDYIEIEEVEENSVSENFESDNPASDNPVSNNPASRETENFSVFGEEKPKNLKKIVCKQLTRLASHIIYDFLKQNGIEEDIVKLEDFAGFILKGILDKTREDIENRKELGGGQ